MNDTRFLNRKCLLIDFHSFENVMQELLDDSSLKIERDYPVLSCYSEGYDCGYDEDEIKQRIGDYLGVNIIAAFPLMDLEEIYFVTDK
jgi:hypothetical protein